MPSRVHSRVARASVLISLLAAAACQKDAPTPAPASSGAGGAAPSSPAAAAAPSSPAAAPSSPTAAAPSEFPPLPSRKELPTTSGNIAIGNLEGDVKNADVLLARTPKNSALMMRLVPIFLLHGKTTGLLREYDRALELAESAVKLEPKSPQAWLTLAKVHSTLHRFQEALADLKRVEALGAHGTLIDMTRASLLQALGRFREARVLLEKLAADNPRIDTLGALATLDADEGRIADAEQRFLKAQESFTDISPFPLVWLWLQQGLMWQKEGRAGRARQLFAAAYERLPVDVAVASHLAAVEAVTGEREQAIARLRQIVSSSDDPEYLGQLSQLLRDSGAAEEADRLRAQAAARYEELLKRHPAAFAEHAARFWLGPGADPKKAVPLAKLNLEQRKTADAYALALEARLTAREPAAETCKLAASALAPPAQPLARVRVLASRAFTACGQKERAEAELRAAAGPAAPAAPGSGPAAPRAVDPGPAPAIPPAAAPAAPAAAPATAPSAGPTPSK